MKVIAVLIAGLAAGLLSSLASAADVTAVQASKQRQHVEFLDSGRFSDLPFSDAVRVGGLTYFSGEIGDVGGNGKVVPGGIQAEARQVMENLKASVEANGYKMSDVVKCTVFLADMAEWSVFNAIYKSYFSKPYPARSAFGANGLALGARVEVECIAAK
ncbi:Rid family detoxifying hydrolase [Herbaspirillum sp. RV1423]|uniref:Rid family detoxifying hydrolase n=1 Tax=Herbaspirillum sp. RV1423 TaxID=1443993 RepID=UPI0004B14DA7|nr:Rid family detoxifying hydrolase [Herbaspirillum sp. RV1423]